jgi:hypothetical protein
VCLLFSLCVILLFIHLIEVLNERCAILITQDKFIAFTQQSLPQLLQSLFIALCVNIGLSGLQRVDTPVDQVDAHAHVVVDVEAVVGVHLDGGELVLSRALLLPIHPVLEQFRLDRDVWLRERERIPRLEIPVCLLGQLELVIALWRAILSLRLGLLYLALLSLLLDLLNDLSVFCLRRFF